ncbi:phototropin 2 [Striga asiatica]|uniref:Phototropin 2 n=1 Tax=Striga asiatica TaxID=4170 RepID=A0A5A7RIY1_STRAF|nr:phototropin 2 [Striga asiatica]
MAPILVFTNGGARDKDNKAVQEMRRLKDDIGSGEVNGAEEGSLVMGYMGRHSENTHHSILSMSSEETVTGSCMMSRNTKHEDSLRLGSICDFRGGNKTPTRVLSGLELGFENWDSCYGPWSRPSRQREVRQGYLEQLQGRTRLALALAGPTI